MKHAHRVRTRQSGLTLVELMVAMTIGLLLLAGTASLFISNKRIYREQEELSRLQENGRFALEMMLNDVRMSGYVGCHDDLANLTNQVSTNAQTLTSYLARVEGSDEAANWLPSNATQEVGNMVAATDGITIRYLDPVNIDADTPMVLTTPMNPSVLDGDLVVADTTGLAVGDLAGISDCATSDVFAITGLSATTISHAALSKGYGTNAQIMRLVARRYFIRDGGNGRSLWMVENGGAAQELIEGVDAMQVMYGIDADADTFPDSYGTADDADAAGWANVVSVRVALLLRTVEANPNNEIDSRIYGLLDQAVGPFDDRRRRRVFSATVAIRNNT